MPNTGLIALIGGVPLDLVCLGALTAQVGCLRLNDLSTAPDDATDGLQGRSPCPDFLNARISERPSSNVGKRLTRGRLSVCQGHHPFCWPWPPSRLSISRLSSTATDGPQHADGLALISCASSMTTDRRCAWIPYMTGFSATMRTRAAAYAYAVVRAAAGRTAAYWRHWRPCQVPESGVRRAGPSIVRPRTTIQALGIV